MSHAIGAVKFKKDGLIKYFDYNGTADVSVSNLVEDQQKVNFREMEWLSCKCKQDEEVEIFTTYGYGRYWNGRACRNCNAITDGWSDYGDEITGKGSRESIHGYPNWYPFKED